MDKSQYRTGIIAMFWGTVCLVGYLLNPEPVTFGFGIFLMLVGTILLAID